MTPTPQKLTPREQTPQEQLDTEVRQATRYERGLAVKALIALGIVLVLVVVRLLVV